MPDPRRHFPAAKWLPSAYMDEVIPLLRDSPEAWLVGSAETGWRIDGGLDEAGGFAVAEGDIVAFDACVDIATAEVSNDERGLIFSDPPARRLVAPPGFSLTVSDGEDIWESLEEAAANLEGGEHTLHVYAWSDRHHEFQLHGGRLIPVLRV